MNVLLVNANGKVDRNSCTVTYRTFQALESEYTCLFIIGSENDLDKDQTSGGSRKGLVKNGEMESILFVSKHFCKARLNYHKWQIFHMINFVINNFWTNDPLGH